MKWNKTIFSVGLEKTWQQWSVDRWDVHIWTGMHHHQQILNFCEEDRNAVKPEIIQCYNKHMGDVDLQHSVINSCSLKCWMWKWTKNYFITLCTWQNWTVSSSWLLFGIKMTHRDLHLSLLRNVTEKSESASARIDPWTGPAFHRSYTLQSKFQQSLSISFLWAILQTSAADLIPFLH
jgi:hypothetical protein